MVENEFQYRFFFACYFSVMVGGASRCPDVVSVNHVFYELILKKVNVILQYRRWKHEEQS